MNEEDAKWRGLTLVERMAAAEEGMVVDKGVLAHGCGTLEWHPVLPGSASFQIMGVEWTTNQDGEIEDSEGNVVGRINFDTGWFQFEEGWGVLMDDTYEASYVYDSIKVLAQEVAFEVRLESALMEPQTNHPREKTLRLLVDLNREGDPR